MLDIYKVIWRYRGGVAMWKEGRSVCVDCGREVRGILVMK